MVDHQTDQGAVHEIERTSSAPARPTLARATIDVLSVSEFLSRPRPTWLVDNLITKSSFVGIIGPSGSGKSFLALDIAFAVATGRAFHGRGVSMGNVVYVAAEDSAGVTLRVAGYCQYHQLSTTELDRTLHFVSRAVDLLPNGECEALIESLRRFTPDLVILDPFARCAVGAEENSATEVGEIIAEMAHISSQLDCTVAVVHHTGTDVRRPRGSSAMRAAFDTEIHVKACGEKITVSCEKQKNAACFEEFELRRVDVKIDDVPDGGTFDSSCVLVDADGLDGEACSEFRFQYTAAVMRCLKVESAGVLTTVELSKQLQLHKEDVRRSIDELEALGLVTIDRSHRPARVSLNGDGLASDTACVFDQKATHSDASSHSSHTPGPLKGPCSVSRGVTKKKSKRNSKSQRQEVARAS